MTDNGVHFSIVARGVGGYGEAIEFVCMKCETLTTNPERHVEEEHPEAASLIVTSDKGNKATLYRATNAEEG